MPANRCGVSSCSGCCCCCPMSGCFQLVRLAAAVLARRSAAGAVGGRVDSGLGRHPGLAADGPSSPPLRAELTRLETFVFALAVGLSAVSTWVLLLGLLGVLERTWVFTAPAIITFLAAAGVCYRRRQRAADSRRLAAAGLLPNSRGLTAPGLPPQHLHHSGRRCLPAMLPTFSAPLALAGPAVCAGDPAGRDVAADDFDVCEYHLQAPKEFFQQGQITFLPHNVYANMTLGTEMLSLLAMVIAGDWWWGALAGKTVIAAFTPLCALALYAAGRRFYSTGAGVVAALVYISIPWVASTSIIPAPSTCLPRGWWRGRRRATCSWQSTPCCCAVGDRARHWTPTGRCPCFGLVDFNLPTACLVLAGYLAGAAVATKYPAVLFVLLPLAAWTFFGRLGGRSGSGSGSGFRIGSPPRFET